VGETSLVTHAVLPKQSPPHSNRHRTRNIHCYSCPTLLVFEQKFLFDERSLRAAGTLARVPRVDVGVQRCFEGLIERHENVVHLPRVGVHVESLHHVRRLKVRVALAVVRALASNQHTTGGIWMRVGNQCCAGGSANIG
jgi:hypothetical protein